MNVFHSIKLIRNQNDEYKRAEKIRIDHQIFLIQSEVKTFQVKIKIKIEVMGKLSTIFVLSGLFVIATGAIIKHHELEPKRETGIEEHRRPHLPHLPPHLRPPHSSSSSDSDEDRPRPQGRPRPPHSSSDSDSGSEEDRPRPPHVRPPHHPHPTPSRPPRPTPTTEAPETEIPETQAPETEGPETEAPVTDETENEIEGSGL